MRAVQGMFLTSLTVWLASSVTAADGMAPATSSAVANSPAPTAEAHYKPGAEARIYLFSADTEWPPPALPKAPAEVLKLSAMPQVSADPVGRGKDLKPNTLVESQLGILQGVRFYAVRFTGWMYAPDDGEYGLVVRSNGPYVLSIEDQDIIKSSYFFDFSRYMTAANGRVYLQNMPADAKLNNTSQGTVKLTAHRYYHVNLTCYAQHGNLNPGTTASPEAMKIMGAELAAFVTTPSGDSSALHLYVPESKSAEPGK